MARRKRMRHSACCSAGPPNPKDARGQVANKRICQGIGPTIPYIEIQGTNYKSKVCADRASDSIGNVPTEQRPAQSKHERRLRYQSQSQSGKATTASRLCNTMPMTQTQRQ